MQEKFHIAVTPTCTDDDGEFGMLWSATVYEDNQCLVGRVLDSSYMTIAEAEQAAKESVLAMKPGAVFI
jgi:hypothetical protein